MEFIFVFAVILFEVFLIHFFEVMELVRAFGIDTLVDDKVFAVFFWNKSIPAVGTAQFHGGEAAFIRREPGGADFAEELAFGTIVLYRKGFGALHRGAGTGVWDITFGPAADRADLLAIAFFVVRDKFLVSPVLSEIGNKGELINLELLVFWGIGIIKSPLPEGDISADEVNQPAVLLIKILNNRK